MRVRKTGIVRRIATAALAAMLGGALAVTPTSPASAGNFNGNCESGEVCVYWLTGYRGPMADFYDNVSNYHNWHFWNSSTWLANNTMSAYNKAFWSCAFIYDSANYGGFMFWIYSDSENGNFEGYSNRAESHKFLWLFPEQC